MVPRPKACIMEIKMKKRPNIFVWDKNLETGIPIVDDQHKNFIIHANKFIIRLLSNKGKEGLEEEFDFIRQYLQYHFQTEEAFQFDSGYPGYKEHQAEHLRLKFKEKEVEIMMAEGTEAEILEKFHAFIEMWVINHIMDCDLKFSLYYRDRKKSAELPGAEPEDHG